MTLVLLYAALACLLAAVAAPFGPAQAGFQRLNLVALGLACGAASQLAVHW